jgi:MFS family permease
VVEKRFCLEQVIYRAAPLYFLPRALRPIWSKTFNFAPKHQQVQHNQGAFQFQCNNQGGQIISGMIGDHVEPKKMIMLGLLIASASNICMILSNSIVYMTVVWAINGFAQAMLWPPIVRILSDNLDHESFIKANLHSLRFRQFM